jgi:hypothetical protein
MHFRDDCEKSRINLMLKRYHAAGSGLQRCKHTVMITLAHISLFMEITYVTTVIITDFT